MRRLVPQSTFGVFLFALIAVIPSALAGVLFIVRPEGMKLPVGIFLLLISFLGVAVSVAFAINGRSNQEHSRNS